MDIDPIRDPDAYIAAHRDKSNKALAKLTGLSDHTIRRKRIAMVEREAVEERQAKLRAAHDRVERLLYRTSDFEFEVRRG